MKTVGRETFELWVEANEHAPHIKAVGREIDDIYTMEYRYTYDGTVAAKVVCTAEGETYTMAEGVCNELSN